METLFRDMRYGIKSLLKHPGFAALAIVTLALGIGVNTAMFSVINAVLLRPLPYAEPDRLVWMAESGDEVANRWISYPNFLDWRERNHVFEAISIFRGWSVNMVGADQPVNLGARLVSADYFRVMRAAPLMGRDFSADDDKPGANPVTIISYPFWQQNFAGDPGIIGKSITLDDEASVVIGVMPQSFVHQGPPPLWLLAGPRNMTHRDWRDAGNVIGRLKPGITLAQARSEMNTISQQLFAEYPRANAGHHRVRLVSLQDSITGNVKPALLILFGAVGLVLLIACANVANLLLARAAARRKEFAVRVALGATRWHIIRQLLVECVLLALIGGGLGLVLAWWSTDLLGRVGHSTVPRLEGLRISYSVLGFNLFLSLLTGFVFGLAPAWRFSKITPHETLKDSDGTATETRGKGLRAVLVTAEVALSVTLLVGSGLLLKSMLRLFNSDLGFDAHRVLTMELKASGSRYNKAQLNQLQQRLLASVSDLSGVQEACLSASLPGFADDLQNDISPEGHMPLKPGEMINVDWAIVSADYFKTMRLPLLRGRAFTKQEADQGLPVVVVDENLARRFWPNEEAVGKHLAYDSPVWHEIIGVAKNVNTYGSEAKPLIKVYTPFGRQPQWNSVLSVLTSSEDPQKLATLIIQEIHTVDKDLPVAEVSTLEDLLAREVSTRQFNTGLFALFALLALILATTGVYGVIAYSVAQRTHEVGVRMALGARQRDVLRLFIAQGMKHVVVGLVLGLLAALALSRLMTSLLFGVKPNDAATFIVVSLCLIVSALLACYLPARRATKVDPLVALRYE